MNFTAHDSYEKLDVAGKGSYGLVWRAKRASDGQIVAIKEISINHMSDAEYEVICKETKILSQVKHPNVIKFFGSFETDSTVSIAMEYASKGSLHHLLSQRAGKILDEQDVLHLFTQLVLGLHYLHTSNILHRDLKPHNVLLLSRNNETPLNKFVVKISDFGLSKIQASQTDCSRVLGTPAYSAPEICNGQPFNDRCDIWSLGCIFYEMLTLEKAFDAPTLAAVVMKIMRGGVKPITNRDCTGAIIQLVNALLHQSPNQRPSTSALMAHPYIAPVLFRTHASLECDFKVKQ